MVNRIVLVLAIATLGCVGRPRTAPSANVAPRRAATEVTLYRDHAVVAHRVEVVIPAASTTTIRITAAAGIDPSNIYVVEKSELTVREVRAIGVHVPAPRPPKPEPEPCGDPCVEVEEEPASVAAPNVIPLAPIEVELVIGGLREGRFTLVVGYDTQRITWETAYTMTTTASRDRAVLRGAIAIRNATGVPLRDANVWVVDTEHGPATGRVAERLGNDLVGREGSSTPIARPRNLGRADLVEGDTRIELLPDAASRPMKSVLVYDPIGTALDHPGVTPVRDASLGVHPPASSRVTESFEIERDNVAAAGLPAGPVRLLERRADGSLALLGESRIFDASTRIASVDTVAVGTADGVTGKRERRELTIDEDRKRLVEEFLITIENTRERPVEVVLREHFYRGQNWALAYQSIPLELAAKEGSQQVVMRISVPARTTGTSGKPGQTKVLYVAVYTW
jgi:hypothetical protein